MNQQLRVAIVGVGGVGAAHCTAFASQYQRCKVVALCDLDANAINRVRRRLPYKVKAFNDYIRMLDRVQPDAVVIALPHHLHAWASIAALERNIHVLCEKPGGLDFADFEQIEAAAQISQAQWVVGLVKRYYRPVEQAEAIVRDGGIGTPFNITFYDEWRHVGLQSQFEAGIAIGKPDWRSVKEYMGEDSVVGDSGFHSLSLIQAFIQHQPYEILCADTWDGCPNYVATDGPDSLFIRTKFGAFGGRASATVSWAMNGAGEPLLRVDGTEGQLVGRFVTTQYGRRQELEWVRYLHDQSYQTVTYRWSDYSDFRLQAADFCRCVMLGIPSRNGLTHARRVAEMREGIAGRLSGQQQLNSMAAMLP